VAAQKTYGVLTDFLDALKFRTKKAWWKTCRQLWTTRRLAPHRHTPGKHPPDLVAIYLNAFNDMKKARWQNLDARLKEDTRLALVQLPESPSPVN